MALARPAGMSGPGDAGDVGVEKRASDAVHHILRHPDEAAGIELQLMPKP